MEKNDYPFFYSRADESDERYNIIRAQRGVHNPRVHIRVNTISSSNSFSCRQIIDIYDGSMRPPIRIIIMIYGL